MDDQLHVEQPDQQDVDEGATTTTYHMIAGFLSSR